MQALMPSRNQNVFIVLYRSEVAKMQKPYTLIIPSWYPTAKAPLNGIFIQKHAEAISTFRNVLVMYITGDQNESTEETVISDSFVRYIYSYRESSSRGFNQIKYIWAQIRAYRHIANKYGRPDSIHLHVVFPGGIFVYLLLLLHNIPLLITEHWTGYMNEDGRYMRLPAIAKYITRILFERAKKISVVSTYFKGVLAQKHLADQSKIMVVYNTLNMPKTVYSQTDDKIEKALYVGNLSDVHKNISVMIMAAELVVREYPSFTLTIVGGGPERDIFVKMSGDKGLLNKNIFFRGFVANDKLTEIYQAHGFFILTSNFETFNISAAEAALCGLPIVSSHCGGPSEFVNEKTGIWIEGKTPRDAANAILQMIKRRDEFNSQNIAHELQEKFSDANILTQLKILYNSI